MIKTTNTIKKEVTPGEYRIHSLVDQIDPKGQYHPLILNYDPESSEITMNNLGTDLHTLLNISWRSIKNIKEQNKIRKENFFKVLKGFQNIFDFLPLLVENDLYHLDIKHDNFVLTPDGLIKMIDFGVSEQGKNLDSSTYEVMYYCYPYELSLITKYGLFDSFYDDPALEYFGLNRQDILKNLEIIKNQNKTTAQLAEIIFPSLDLYGVGLTLVFLSYEVRNIIPRALMEDLGIFIKKITNYYTDQRINVYQAKVEYQKLIQKYFNTKTKTKSKLKSSCNLL